MRVFIIGVIGACVHSRQQVGAKRSGRIVSAAQWDALLMVMFVGEPFVGIELLSGDLMVELVLQLMRAVIKGHLSEHLINFFKMNKRNSN